MGGQIGYCIKIIMAISIRGEQTDTSVGSFVLVKGRKITPYNIQTGTSVCGARFACPTTALH